MIDVDSIELFKKNKATLKETSKDSANETFMTNLEIEVINFDKVKEDYSKKLELQTKPKSNDALLYANGKLTFIEFKNGKIVQSKKNTKDNASNEVSAYELRRKIFDSVPIFTDIVQTNISFTRENMDYVLVYNEEKNSRKMISKHLHKSAKTNFICFGLEYFKKYFFKDVFTYTQNEFEKLTGESQEL